ncbi:MAG TPA: hypothetical protein VIE66_18680 [Methylocella sp.]|jgi:hypothetical protein
MQNQENTASNAEARDDPKTAETAALDGHHASRLSRQEAAQFLTNAGLPIAATTLAKKAVQGNGPPYALWNGRTMYAADALLEWAEAQVGPKLTSTAQRQKGAR